MSAKNMEGGAEPSLEPGDFYFNNKGLMVFTAQYLLKRGFCCQYGCQHCPYGPEDPKNHGEKDQELN